MFEFRLVTRYSVNTILKIGGSLLDLPDLTQRMLKLIDGHAISDVIVVTGGGSTADRVRQWDEQFGLDASSAHWLAIRAMSFNAALLSATDDRFQLVESMTTQSPLKRAIVQILDVEPIVRSLEIKNPPLPETWDVTSDSIAAWIATLISADRLILAKSVGLPSLPRATSGRAGVLRKLCDRKVVDPLFIKYAVEIPRIDWCNFRAEPLELNSVS